MAKATIFFDNRATKNNDGIIKICVYHERKQRLYTTGIKIDKDSWERLQKNINENGISGRVRDEYLLNIYELLYQSASKSHDGKNGFLPKANEIINRLGSNFTFDKFKYSFDGNDSNLLTESSAADLKSLYQFVINQMNTENRIGNAQSYENSIKSINRFCKEISVDDRLSLDLPKRFSDETPIPFNSITISFLNSYEKWMYSYGNKAKIGVAHKGASSSTIGIYLRHLRAIMNEAIAQGLSTNYPFGKRKYQIPAAKNIKKALSRSEVNQIINFKSNGDLWVERSLDFWIFSYLGNGMNFGDILKLKKENYDISKNSISFIRSKTQRTNKSNQKLIKFELLDKQVEIINKYRNPDCSSEYLFPYLNENMDALKIKQTISQFIKVTNKHMKNIGEQLGFKSTIGTYVARHSFSTILLQSNAPLAYISQSLGHTSIATTQAYLGSFEEEQERDFRKALM